MQPLSLTGNWQLVAAIFLGMAFGVVLSKSGMTDPDAVRNALRLRNGRILKTVLTALGVGAVLFFITRHLGLTVIQVRPGYLWGSVFGGICCGAGLAIAGISAATLPGSAGEGRWHVVWVAVGMIFGAAAVNVATELLSKTVSSFEKMPSPPEPERFFEISNPVWYVLLGAALLLVMVHWTAGDKEE